MTTTLKVVLLGKSGVGKTAILDLFTNDIFNENLMFSLSAQFISKTIILEELNQTIKFDLWDTSGNNRFRSLSKIFYHDANVICLCYDSTNKYSFKELKNYWHDKEIKIRVDNDPILVIVATKNDLYINQEVGDEEGKTFAKEINAIFQSTSAKSYFGITSLFENIARKYFDPSFDFNEIENRKKRVKLNNFIKI